MIFVTVGTHEQPFNRLIEYMDQMKRDGLIEEEVIIQTGYSTYEPRYCKWEKFFPYQDMVKFVHAARIVITHGGPASFLMPLQIGKTPIVVPRKFEYREHVNNHQAEFCRIVARRLNIICVIEEIEELDKIIENYEKITSSIGKELKSNNQEFNLQFEKLVQGMFEDYDLKI